MCSDLKSVVTASLNYGNVWAFRLAHGPNEFKSRWWVRDNCEHAQGVVEQADEEQDLGNDTAENCEESEDELVGEDSIEQSTLRKEPDRTILEESDDAKDTCQGGNTCCEVEEMLLPGLLEQWVLISLELFQVVLEEESPNAELDDQLTDALDERFKGGSTMEMFLM